MAKIEPFEKYSSRYEEWFERNKFAYESELEAVRKLLPEKGRGIEIGVGSGRFAEPLGIKFGIEPSPKMGEIAKKRGVEVIAGVAEMLPFGDSQLDFGLMVTTVCFLENIEAAFKEVYRVLKNGGLLIIGFIDSESPLGRSYKQGKKESVFYREATFYSVGQIVAYLKEAGFNDFDFRQTIFRDLSEIKESEPVKEGYGEGSFVVVKAGK